MQRREAEGQCRFHGADISPSGMGEVRIVSCIALAQVGRIYAAMGGHAVAITLMICLQFF
jgi:hypothetical protein